MQEIGVVALLGGRDAERLETLVRVFEGIEARAPALVGKRWIGDDIVEDFKCVAFHEFWIC